MPALPAGRQVTEFRSPIALPIPGAPPIPNAHYQIPKNNKNILKNNKKILT
jgi:hypothetical protein